MTNLTEQWKKDRIHKGTFYCKSELNGHHCIASFVSNKGLFDCAYNGTLNKGYWKVIAEVPSYEQWIMTKNLSERAHLEMYKARGEKVKLEKENTKLKEQINHLLKTQARQFVDNQNLQVKAERAKDVVNIDTARQIKQLKELLKEVLRHELSLKEVTELTRKISEVLGE